MRRCGEACAVAAKHSFQEAVQPGAQKWNLTAEDSCSTERWPATQMR
jgi:hypothetical protein